jgi:hypothetical protein
VKGEGWVDRRVGGGSKRMREIEVDMEIDLWEHWSEAIQDLVGQGNTDEDEGKTKGT